MKIYLKICMFHICVVILWQCCGEYIHGTHLKDVYATEYASNSPDRYPGFYGELTPSEIAEQTVGSVVKIDMEDDVYGKIISGSGFFVGNGTIATNLHVVQGAAKGYVKIVNRKTRNIVAGTVGYDPDSDLALLYVRDATAPPLKIGDSTRMKVGDKIFAVGNPLGLEGTFSSGIISAVRLRESTRIFQITAPISEGSSGGPVLNTMGEVIGISVATSEKGQNINFAIPSGYLENLLSNKTNVMPLRTIKGPSSVFRSKRPAPEKGDLDLNVVSFRLYGSVGERVEPDRRNYNKKFNRYVTKYIHWELLLERKSGKYLTYYRPEYMYYYENKKICGSRFTVKVQPHVTRIILNHGCGFEKRGKWKEGKYRVDVLIEGKILASESFEVY